MESPSPNPNVLLSDSVVVRQGVTLRDALSKALKLRNLTWDKCEVLKTDENIVIPWDTDIATLEAREVTVRTLDEFRKTCKILHRFARKNFYDLSFCGCCNLLLHRAYYCSQCNFKFHLKCNKNLPQFCFQIRLPNTDYAVLLAPHTETQENRLDPLVLSIDGDVEDTRDRSVSLQNRSVSMPNAHELIRSLADDSPWRNGHEDVPDTSPRGRTRSADESTKIVLYRRESYDDWAIPSDEVLFGKKIGTGSYGTVHKAHWHGPVAVKMLKVKIPTAERLQAFKNEVRVLCKTRHSNIVLFMGCISKPSLGIVTQWCDGFTLHKHLHVLDTPISLLYVIDMARQLAQGMDYLHARNIIHRDLKSPNIFLHDDWTVKIGDFGLATVKTQFTVDEETSENREKRMQLAGSVLWMAPEVLRLTGPTPYTFGSDVYAYGILLYELMVRELPFPTLSQIIYMVGSGLLRPQSTNFRADAPAELTNIFEACVQSDRNGRPTFRNILTILDSIMETLPRMTSSASEPSLVRVYDDVGEPGRHQYVGAGLFDFGPAGSQQQFVRDLIQGFWPRDTPTTQ